MATQAEEVEAEVAIVIIESHLLEDQADLLPVMEAALTVRTAVVTLLTDQVIMVNPATLALMAVVVVVAVAVVATDKVVVVPTDKTAIVATDKAAVVVIMAQVVTTVPVMVVAAVLLVVVEVMAVATIMVTAAVTAVAAAIVVVIVAVAATVEVMVVVIVDKLVDINKEVNLALVCKILIGLQPLFLNLKKTFTQNMQMLLREVLKKSMQLELVPT